MLCAKLLEIGPVVLEKKISYICILLFVIISPLKWALKLNKFGSILPRDALCQVWLKLVQWYLRRRFLNLVNVYLVLVIISPWKTECPFIWTNLNPFTQGCFVLIKFCWKVLVQWFWRNVFSLFCYSLPLEKAGAFHLNKLEYPSLKDALCHIEVWLKLVLCYWKRRFLNVDFI